jgi:diacylglycerol kinase family enzyme
LGIPHGVTACDVLSSRLVEELDLGKVNNHYFLTSLHVPGAVRAECDGRYTVSPVSDGEIHICNFAAGDRNGSDPRDGWMETMVKTATRGFFRNMFQPSYATAGVSVFPTQKVVIRSNGNEQMTAVADGQPYNDAEFRIEIAPKRLKAIVGKERTI